MRIKNYFHINGFAFSFAWKKRLGLTRKWPPTKTSKISYHVSSLDDTVIEESRMRGYLCQSSQLSGSPYESIMGKNAPKNKPQPQPSLLKMAYLI